MRYGKMVPFLAGMVIVTGALILVWLATYHTAIAMILIAYNIGYIVAYARYDMFPDGMGTREIVYKLFLEWWIDVVEIIAYTLAILLNLKKVIRSRRIEKEIKNIILEEVGDVTEEDIEVTVSIDWLEKWANASISVPENLSDSTRKKIRELLREITGFSDRKISITLY